MSKRGVIQKIADAAGVDHQTVRRSLDSAGISPEDRSFDFDKAVATVKDIADPARVSGHDVSRRSTSLALQDARARYEEQRVRKLEIENQRAEGALISREAATAAGEYLVATARVALLSLGHRIAPKVAGMTDLTEISQLIEREVRDVLGAVADETAFWEKMEAEVLS